MKLKKLFLQKKKSSKRTEYQQVTNQSTSPRCIQSLTIKYQKQA